MLDVRPCSSADLERLCAVAAVAAYHRHHRERFETQQGGIALHLVAWNAGAPVGHGTLLFQSKYAAVRRRFSAGAEMNAIAAYPTGQGTGTAILAAAERLAAVAAAATMGLAVEVTNLRAARLYKRLGYVDWGDGTVIDEWAERDHDGAVVAEHKDECFYVAKPLGM